MVNTERAYCPECEAVDDSHLAGKQCMNCGEGEYVLVQITEVDG